jgi:hypothetical protein
LYARADSFARAAQTHLHARDPLLARIAPTLLHARDLLLARIAPTLLHARDLLLARIAPTLLHARARLICSHTTICWRACCESFARLDDLLASARRAIVATHLHASTICWRARGARSLRGRANSFARAAPTLLLPRDARATASPRLICSRDDDRSARMIAAPMHKKAPSRDR